jgi:hypothetical protein
MIEGFCADPKGKCADNRAALHGDVWYSHRRMCTRRVLVHALIRVVGSPNRPAKSSTVLPSPYPPQAYNNLLDPAPLTLFFLTLYSPILPEV